MVKSNFTAFGRLVACSILAGAVAGLSSAQVPNSGFENGTGTIASNWIKFGNAFREAGAQHSGSFAMKMYGNFTGGSNTTGVYQDFKVKAGQRVIASTFAINQTSDAMAGDNYALLKVIYRNAANVDLAFAESTKISAGTQRDKHQLISASLGPAPVGTDHCSVFLLFVQPGSTPFAPGSTKFDDVDVSVTSADATTLVWSDEFDGSDLDTTNWEVMTGDGTAYGLPAGWGNNELQFYTNRPQNVSVSNGLLHIIARKEQFSGYGYTSARLRTKGKRDFLYGRMEARLKVPAGQGYWPAFWMMPTASAYGTWAASGEIDILETINQATSAYGTIHFGGPAPANTSSGGSYANSNGYNSDFHVFAIEWEPDAIRWYVDGILYYTRSSQEWYSTAATWNERAPFDQSFHFLLNLAVGGNWPGNPNANTVFPGELSVDYVRVYKTVRYKSLALTLAGP